MTTVALTFSPRHVPRIKGFRLKRLLFLCLLFIVVGESPLRAIVGGELGLTPEEEAIRHAASVEGSRREEALRIAIRNGLGSTDPAVRDGVFSYLSKQSRWIDLAPYAEVIEQFSRTDALHRGLWLLDDNELARASREARLAAYRAAILTGVERLARGRPLTRESAMAYAAYEGMTEIEPLVTQFAPMVEERWRESFHFEAFSTLFQLANGARDREDAGRVAAARLSAIEDSEFASRMGRNHAFQVAVLQVGSVVCAANPFNGERSAGCTDMRHIVTRQIALDQKTHNEAAQEQSAAPATGASDGTTGWLSKLRANVPAS